MADIDLDLDLTDDFESWDQAEPVSHVSERTAGDLTQTGVLALRMPISRREAASSNGVYTAGDVAWIVPGLLLSRAPKPGDRINDSDGTAWTVLDTSYSRLLKRYRLNTRNLVLHADLRDTITIQRPVRAQDASGSDVPVSVTLLYEDLAARIQEVTAQFAPDVLGKRNLEKRYEVFVGQRVTVRAEDQVLLSEVVYEITGYREPDRIDSLMVLECVRRA